MKMAVFSAYDDLIKIETAINELLKTVEKVHFIKQSEIGLANCCKLTISVWYD